MKIMLIWTSWAVSENVPDSGEAGVIVTTIKLLKQLLKQFQPVSGFDTNSFQAQLKG